MRGQGPGSRGPLALLFETESANWAIIEQMLGEKGLVVIGEIGRHSRIMRRKRSEGESAPMTLGGALAAEVHRVVQGMPASGRAITLLEEGIGWVLS